MAEFSADKPCRILSLDGGGAKGFYALGVLKGIEGMLGGAKLSDRFDLVFGTSTGSIIAAMVALGYTVDDIHQLYKKRVVKVIGKWLPSSKSKALQELAVEVFGDADFTAVRTHVGLVTTKWHFETPMIFKTAVEQAHGDRPNFVPGFGCKIGDVVQASCSAFPFFRKKWVTTSTNERFLLADGGYCANNPTLYALADATQALEVDRKHIRVVSIGVGEYPLPRRYLSPAYWIGYWFTVRFIQRLMEINTKSMNQLRHVLFQDVRTIRINKAYTEPQMATDLFEADLGKLELVYQRGRESFREYENDLKKIL